MRTVTNAHKAPWTGAREAQDPSRVKTRIVPESGRDEGDRTGVHAATSEEIARPSSG
jgi:hypothetical protein